MELLFAGGSVSLGVRVNGFVDAPWGRSTVWVLVATFTGDKIEEACFFGLRKSGRCGSSGLGGRTG